MGIGWVWSNTVQNNVSLSTHHSSFKLVNKPWTMTYFISVFEYIYALEEDVI